MQYLLRFWYVDSFAWVWEHYKSVLGNFEAQLAIRTTWKNLGKPLFQDYTFQGKIIGFFFRIFRILFGLILYGIIGIVTLIIFAAWLLLPLLCLISILGFFFAKNSPYCQCIIS